MQKMAEGGIVAFADGGVNRADEEQRRAYAYEQYKRDSAERATADPFGLAGALSSAYTGAKKWLTAPPPSANVGDDTQNADIRQIAPTAVTPDALAAQSQTQAGTPTGQIPPQTQAPGAPPASQAGLQSLSMSQRTSGSMGGGGGGGAPAGLSYMDQLKKTRDAQGPAVDPEAEARGELSANRVASAEQTKAELDADIESQAGMFDKREARQNERGEALEKSKETNKGLAFLEAGLAMMQARGPGLAAIAQGAGVGVKQYSAGLKDLKLAQEKLDEARDKTDELRQNQSSMNKKEQRAASADIRNTTLAGQAAEIDARMKITGDNKADTRAAVASDIESALKREKLRSDETIANNAILNATMKDTRADERSRLSAATDMMKSSQAILTSQQAQMMDPKELQVHKDNYVASQAVLKELAKIPTATAAQRAEVNKWFKQPPK